MRPAFTEIGRARYSTGSLNRVFVSGRNVFGVVARGVVAAGGELVLELPTGGFVAHAATTMASPTTPKRDIMPASYYDRYVHRSLILVASVFAIACPACGKKDEPEAKQPDMELKRANEQRNVRKPNRTPPARRTVQAPTATTWSKDQRKEFCDRVFGITEVNQLLGFGAETVSNVQRQPLSTPARTAGCKYTLPAAPKRPPQYEAQFMLDCRKGVIHTKEMTKRGFMSGKKPQKMESVDIGAGGTYGHFLVAMGKYKAPIHQLHFILKEPKCSVTVRTRFLAKEHARDLAKHVERRVDKNNAPL